MEFFLQWSKTSTDLEETDAEDDALVRSAIKNRAAFAPLYKRYVVRVYRYVYSRVGNVAEAEDLTAQVFEDAINSLTKYRSQGTFAGWLFTIAYRRCADYHRRPKTGIISEKLSGEFFSDPLEQVIHQENFRRLEKLLSELKEEERELLRLHFASRLTYRQIAQVLRRSEGAIKVAMSRLIQKLKSRWEAENE